MVDFAGWEMPVQYSSVISEHQAVRGAAGLFDVSHMGEIEFTGPGALETANRLITNDLNRCADGQALYAGLLNEQGGFVDDVVVYRFSPERIMFCVNASNREKDFYWMSDHSPRVKPVDLSDQYAQLALQGPATESILQPLTAAPLIDLKTYCFIEALVAGIPCIVSRTGYTGEDGFELYCPASSAVSLWASLLESGESKGLVPAGLGARDSLRIEMKYALYGQDIDDQHTPLEAGLGWIVKWDKDDFVGRSALLAQKTAGLSRKLIGLELLGNGIPRGGYRISQGGVNLGVVTSGTLGPSVQRAIGLGYVPLEYAEKGALFEVEIRGRGVPARTVKTPFLERMNNG